MLAYPGGITQQSGLRSTIAASTKESEPFAGLTLVSMSGEDDARGFERTFGIPGSLVQLADERIGAQENAAAAEAIALQWIDTPVPGTDLSAVPGTVALWLLERAGDEDRIADAPDIRAVIAEVRELHDRLLAGEAVSRSAWTETRAHAIAVADTHDYGTASAAARLAETLAWPPLVARTILAEGARVYAEIAAASAAGRSDLSAEDRAHIQTVMEALFAETAEQREADPENNFFPDLFAARHPDLSARFVADLKIGNDAYAAALEACADAALTAIRAVRAPMTAHQE